MLRLPDGMRERIADLARENKRSMNAEIVARLEESLEIAARDFGVDIRIKRLEEALEQQRIALEDVKKLVRD